MSQNDRYKEIIKREMAKLTKPVRLKVFTSQRTEVDGRKIRACMDCGQFMALLRIYEENSNGMLTVEELSIDDNPEFARRYDIQRVPTILFIDDNGRELIRYLSCIHQSNPIRGGQASRHNSANGHRFHSRSDV